MPVFEWVDYCMIGAYLVSMLVLGIVFSGRQRSLEEYFHASGSIPWWAVSVSILATGLSPITYLAGPGWVFSKDSRYMLVSGLIALTLIPLAVVIWVPLWSRLRVMSIYEYLEKRYDPRVRTFGAVVFLIGTVFWLGTALTTAAMGFESVTGFSGRWCLLVMVVLGTMYTVMGGMRAVIWTDVAQFIIFMLGYAVIFVVLLMNFDFDALEIWRTASTTISEETGYPHTKLISFELDPNVEATIWVVLFSRLMGAIAFGSDQLTVQRLHATGSRRSMIKAIFGGQLCGLLYTLVAMPAAWGFVAFYQKHPELRVDLAHPDQVLPHFVVNELPVLMRSFIMAGVLAALMSTFDSAINGMSNITINDFWRRYFRTPDDPRFSVLVARLLTVAFGLLLLMFALWQYDKEGATALQKLGILNNLIAAPVVSFFLLGIFSRRANTGGAVCGALAGVLFTIIFNGVPGLIDKSFDWFNWMWIGGLATMVNVAVGYAASFLFAPPAVPPNNSVVSCSTK